MHAPSLAVHGVVLGMYWDCYFALEYLINNIDIADLLQLNVAWC